MIFHFKVQNEEEFHSRLLSRQADENHHLLAFWEPFENSRIGLYTYLTDNSALKGYYEDGTRTKEGNLQRAKVWFYGRYSPKSHCFKGWVSFSPLLQLIMLCILAGSCVAPIIGGIGGVIEFLFVVALTAIFEIWIGKSETEVFRILKGYCT